MPAGLKWPYVSLNILDAHFTRHVKENQLLQNTATRFISFLIINDTLEFLVSDSK